MIARIKTYTKKNKKVLNAIKRRLLAFAPLLILGLQLHMERMEIRERGLTIRELTAINEFLRERVDSQARNDDDIDIPIWEKLLSNGEFVMINVNKKYVSLFLQPLGLTERDYIGSTDFDIHDYEAASEYYTLDSLVVATGKTHYEVEKFIDTLGKNRPLLVIKWRKFEAGEVYVRGAAVPLDVIIEKIQDQKEQ